MFKDITLGKFSFDLGGKIFVAPSENMEYGFETVSCIHELYHASLSSSTNIGLLMHMLELEIYLEQKDNEYMKRLIDIKNALYEATREIQEVYANTMELLWVEETYGLEVRKEIYRRKTEGYKKYLSISESIWNNEYKTVTDRRKDFHDICTSILNMDLDKEISFLFTDYNFGDRRYEILNQIIHKNLCDTLQNGKGYVKKEIAELDEIIKFSNMVFKHVTEKMKQAFVECKSLEGVDRVDLLLENIRTFDFSELGIRLTRQYDKLSNTICVIHNIQTVSKEINVGLIQYYSKEGKYEMVEVNKNDLASKLEERKWVIIPCKDFSFRKNKSLYDDFDEKTIFILVPHYQLYKRRLCHFGYYWNLRRVKTMEILEL